MTADKQFALLMSLNALGQALHKQAQYLTSRIDALESEAARLQTHIEGLQARAAQADRRRRKVRA